ncbi:MAG TPA: hypothetical protein EYN66_15710 [Myxococcales bacterium]|nr:hypothetical protein [Myxococcales bacterium]
MSTFMFGGSGLQLDIGAKNATGATVNAGDILAIDASLVGADGGFDAIIPLHTTSAHLVNIHGVVIGSSTKSSFTNGEEILLRVVGLIDAKVVNGIGVGDALAIADGSDALAAAAAFATPPAVTDIILGVAHAANASGGDLVVACFINGMTR